MARKAKTRAAALAATAGFAGAGAQAASAAEPQREWDGTAWVVAYPNQRSTDDPLLAAIYSRVQSGAALEVADLGMRASATAQSKARGYNADRIILDENITGTNLARLRSRNRHKQRNAVKQLYGTLLHEKGHVDGLEHSHDGTGHMSAAYTEAPAGWKKLLQQLRADGLVPQPTATRTATKRRQPKRQAK